MDNYAKQQFKRALLILEGLLCQETNKKIK